MEEAWRRIGRGLEEDWKRIGGGLEEAWRRIGRLVEKNWSTPPPTQHSHPTEIKKTKTTNKKKIFKRKKKWWGGSGEGRGRQNDRGSPDVCGGGGVNLTWVPIFQFTVY